MRKNLLKLTVGVFLLCSTQTISAQITKEQLQERKEMKEMTKAELNEKASKAARKEAKNLKKEGWQVAPGALPIDKQLDKVYTMKYEIDDDMFPKWVMGEAMSIGQNYDAAKIQAIALAKQNLAGEIQTEITALIENNVDNKQLEPEEAVSVAKTVSASKQLISQNIGRTLTVIEMYRTLPNKNKEVRVQIAYSAKMAKSAAKKAIRDDLEKQGDELGKKLDQLLGW
ncbi:MAG: hypothetical protein IKO82_04005 [Prevotella sp.]|nr:hypothetical protein [Prevotella sp.]